MFTQKIENSFLQNNSETRANILSAIVGGFVGIRKTIIF